MGSARWEPDDWKTYSSTTSTKKTDDIFVNKSLKDDLNPFDVKVRESRDSDFNPQSTPIIIGLDVTGSMGMIADNLARQGLGVLVEEILDRKPVSDPHIMAMGIGDAYYDRAPLQVTQFEADITIAKQLENIWLEKGGGNNDSESYHLPWYFAAMHTSTDAFEKRNKKGYLFTVGDEQAPDILLKAQIKKIFNDDVQDDYSAQQLLTMVSRFYHVFHVVVEEGSYARSHLSHVMNSWTNLLGQRVLRLSDHKKLAEVVVSAIEVTEGKDAHTVASSWTGNTSLVVSRAISGLSVKHNEGRVVRF